MSIARTWLTLFVIALCGVWLAASVYAGEEGAAHDDQAAAHGEAHDDHAGHGPASTSPVSVDPDLALWTVGVFAVLLLVLWKFAWTPIAEALDKREQGIAANIEEAKHRNEEAKQILSQYEAKLAAAQEEVRGVMEEARRDAEHTHREILAKANSEAEVIRDRAKREIETATDAALKELAETSANLAVELAGKIVRAELNADSHAQLIADAVSKLPQRAPSTN